MKFLIDTNVFIPLEPTSPNEIEGSTALVTELARLIFETNNQIYMHPLAISDIQRDKNHKRRQARKLLFNKYPKLSPYPPISAQIEKILGRADRVTRDWVDNHLIAALKADAVDFLVTEDREIRKRASHLGLKDRVITVAEAISIVKGLFDITPPAPPAVKSCKAYQLDENDPIFDSFRRDYPDFNEWLKKCKKEHRQTWIIEGDDKNLAGVCIVKGKKYPKFGLQGTRLKICSFKVSEKYNGFRYGELLLKSVFDFAQKKQV